MVRRLTSSSLWRASASDRGFFCPLGQKRLFMLFLLILGVNYIKLKLLRKSQIFNYISPPPLKKSRQQKRETKGSFFNSVTIRISWESLDSVSCMRDLFVNASNLRIEIWREKTHTRKIRQNWNCINKILFFSYFWQIRKYCLLRVP